MIPNEPPEKPDFRLALLNEEIQFLEREWNALADLNQLIRELADHALRLASESNAALARCLPHLDDHNLIMTADLPARQFVAHLLETRPSLVRRWPRGQSVVADPPYDPSPILSVIRKVRGRQHRKDPPNVAGFYKVFYLHPDRSVGFTTSFGVIEVGPPPHGAVHFRKSSDEEWAPLSTLDLPEISFSGPYPSKAEADEAGRFRPQ